MTWAGRFVLLFFSGISICAATAQQKSSTPGNKQAPATSSYGQTVFSRDASTAPSISNGSDDSSIVKSASGASLISDAERTALTYRSYSFEIHLDPAQQSLSVRAHLVAQNAGNLPLQRIAVQLSSSLHWESVRIDGRPVKFQSESVESDIDHTGKLTEAVVPLAAPLAPGATMRMDVMYSGVAQQSSTRLLRLGAPASVAATSEWDSIGPDFTALRGFGNVIWFPVSTAPVLLGQGSEMFDSVGKWKLRQADAPVDMHVLVEYRQQPPTVALLDGYIVRPEIVPSERDTKLSDGSHISDTAVPRVLSFRLAPTKLGFSSLSFFVLRAQEKQFPGLTVFSRTGNESSAAAYAKIATANRALIEQWLGPRPKRTVVLIDLPESNDLPFEERNILLLPLQANVSEEAAGPVLAHMLSHAYFISPRVWLDEGVAQLMTLLWIEQRAGRAGAIAQMDSRRAALALAETNDPGINPGQSLIQAWSDIYYRDKAAYVLWMLRDIAGDVNLATALQAYDPAADREPGYLQALLQKTSSKNKAIEWFFDDWVYRDHGLPDLNIVSAYLRSILTKNSAAKNYLVSVDVQNDSYCSTEVPVTVNAVSTVQTKRLIVPSHGRASLRVLLESKPDQVIVNDGSVPEVGTPRHESLIQSAQ